MRLSKRVMKFFCLPILCAAVTMVAVSSRIFQRVKETIGTLSSALSVKFSLVIVPILLLSAFAPLPGIAGSSFAASTTHAACPLTLQRGSFGPPVKMLQTDLNNAYQRSAHVNNGYQNAAGGGVVPFSDLPFDFKPPLSQDGIFGPLTENAVKDFQESYSLVPDGIVGPLTWGALLGGCGAAAPPPSSSASAAASAGANAAGAPPSSVCYLGKIRIPC